VINVSEKAQMIDFMSAKIIHTSCDDGEADDTNGDDQRSWMTAERMTQQGCDDQRGWMTIYN
jgi:hypothetical protein